MPLRSHSTRALWPVAGAGALIAAGLSSCVVASISAGGDYRPQGAVAGDNAAPALQALAQGRLGAFLAHQPLMGLASLLLRAPVVWAGAGLGGGALLLYRLGALICMLPAAALVGWLVADARAHGALPAAALAGLAVIAGAPTVATLAAGHPEELLAATLATASLLAARRGRLALAGALAGSAVGAKEWAVIVLAPLALSLSGADRRERLRAGAICLLAALALALAPGLADPGALERAARSLGDSRLVTALSAWWPLARASARLPGAAALAGTLPAWLDKTSSLALGVGSATALCLALGLLGESRRGWLRSRGRRTDPLAMLCLLALVRCLADPAPVEYYLVALLVPLACWEAGVLRKVPLSTIALLGVVWLLYRRGPALGASFEDVATLALGAVAIAWLAMRALWLGDPGRCGPPADRAATRDAGVREPACGRSSDRPARPIPSAG